MSSTRSSSMAAAALIAASTFPSAAATFQIASAPGLFTPSSRGGANTTYLGWDLFGPPGPDPHVINDTTPDIGTGSGSFVTTNGEDHLSSSGNYYSGGGSVAEEVTFGTDGTVGTGFTTVFAQGVTLFGGFGTELVFGDIAGVSPEVVQGSNATGNGQFFAKWEVPGNESNYSFTVTTGPGSLISFDRFEVDTAWSADGFVADTAQIPEPTVALLACASAGLLLRRRR